MKPGRHVDSIDGLRAIAVLAVLLHHATAGLNHSTAGLVSLCSAYGVDLFFVISGFCLSYPYLRRLRDDASFDLSYVRFMVRRLVRIGPPYYVALFGFALLSLGPFGFPAAFDHVTGRQALAELGFDAAFLTADPVFNVSFWTLGVEMRWYLLFPLLLGLYARSRLAFFAVGLGCYAVYQTSWSVADAGMLPSFMLGIVAADLRILRPDAGRFAALAAAPVLAAAVWQQAGSAVVDHGNPLWALAAFLVVVAAGCEPVGRCLRVRPLVLVGTASYSIYLVHQPVLMSLYDAGWPAWAAALASLASGFVFFGAVERPLLERRVRAAAEAAIERGLRAVRVPALAISSKTSS